MFFARPVNAPRSAALRGPPFECEDAAERDCHAKRHADECDGDVDEVWLPELHGVVKNDDADDDGHQAGKDAAASCAAGLLACLL